MQIRRFAKIPLPFLMVLFLSSCAGMLSSCGPNTVRSLIPTLQEFIGFTIPLLKRGRTAASFTASSGKFALKIEQEIIKDGLKLNASFPLATYQDVATAMYMALHNGKRPPDAFDESKGMFIIVVHNGEKTAFLSEQNVVCVANVAEAQLVRISQDRRFLTINATQEVTDVMFAVDEGGCQDIESEIVNRKAQEKAKQEMAISIAVENAKRAMQTDFLPAEKSAPTPESTSEPVFILPMKNAQQCSQPAYPKDSERNEEEGTVTLSLLVNPYGEVIEAEVERSSGFRNLDRAALQAGRQCRYTPGLINGHPAQFNVTLVFEFKIEN